jgi:hypothetical protein
VQQVAKDTDPLMWWKQSRHDINRDMLIWLSESSLAGWFSEVSLIRDNQGRETVWLSTLPSFPILPTIHRSKHLTE